MRTLLSVLLAVGAAATAPPSRFEVTSLPGWTGPLPSKMYSGFIDAGVPPSGKGTMYFHYIGFMAEENPADAPTVLWYNGGPGASSLFGMFQELGPLFLNVDSEATESYNKTGIPTPIYNPYTWSKRFNLFAIDSPPPVGFSYCTEYGPSGNGTSCGPWTDTAVFKANYNAVTTLMTSIFPELLKNPFFITGESYAGVYVPGLINTLLEQGLKGINLKGYAVGDGCMGIDLVCMNLQADIFEYPGTWAGPWYDVEFFAGHGQISNELYYKIKQTCSEEEMRSGKMSVQCKNIIGQMKGEIGGFFVYDLYDDCPSNMVMDGLHKGKSRRRSLMRMMRGADNDYACSGTAMTDYLGRSDVLTAMGIPTDDYFFNADNGFGFNYTENVRDVRPFHEAAVKRNLRVLIYEGDSDASGLSSYGLQDVYVDLWPRVGLQRTQSWRPWTTDGKNRMGGYAMEWNNRQVAHLTIRGSGHMVPLNKPAQSFTMINAFVFNTEYPHYSPQ